MTPPRWKLLVEGLGKIERAEVEVRPLMLFVGDNNSGKSYLASVLWGLLEMQGNLPLPEGPTLAACEAWLTARREERERRPVYQLSVEDRELFARLFNEMIRKDDVFVRYVFNSLEMTLARIDVTPLHGHAIEVAWKPVEPNGDSRTVVYLREEMLDVPRRGEGYRAYMLKYLASEVALGFEPDSHRKPVFLPAARSSFMLLYREVARRSFEQFAQPHVSPDETGLKLTRPTFTFIDLLAFGMKQAKGPYAAEADALESGIDGRVELISGPVGINDYTYRPSGSANLHLSLASSLVTELAPIILVLRHLSGFPVLVLEEPEAHLHPKLQRRLAQVVVRLVRKGLFVWITTHSESFCQQINDFMKIGAVSDRERLRAEMQASLGYAYGEEDYLTPDDVGGYELVNEGERSVVRALAKHPDGLVMPTFNREMVALAREVTFLEQRLDEGA